MYVEKSYRYDPELYLPQDKMDRDSFGDCDINSEGEKSGMMQLGISVRTSNNSTILKPKKSPRANASSNIFFKNNSNKTNLSISNVQNYNEN